MQFLRWRGMVVLFIGLILVVVLITDCGKANLTNCEECKLVPDVTVTITPELVPTDVPEAITEASAANTTLQANKTGITPEISESASTQTSGAEKNSDKSLQEENTRNIMKASSQAEKEGSDAVEIAESSSKTIKKAKVDKVADPIKMIQAAEALSPTPTPSALVEDNKAIQIYMGYIIDRDCFEDPGPEKDTLDCLLMESCRESGYGLAVKSGDDYIWYEFDDTGKDKAYEILKNTTRFKKILVTVEGALENNILTVNDMYENEE